MFRHSERFVAAIKQYLCLSLLKNVTSSVSQAQALTCSIFFTLLVKFRQVWPLLCPRGQRSIENLPPAARSSSIASTALLPGAEDTCSRDDRMRVS